MSRAFKTRCIYGDAGSALRDERRAIRVPFGQTTSFIRPPVYFPFYEVIRDNLRCDCRFRRIEIQKKDLRLRIPQVL